MAEEVPGRRSIALTAIVVSLAFHAIALIILIWMAAQPVKYPQVDAASRVGLPGAGAIAALGAQRGSRQNPEIKSGFLARTEQLTSSWLTAVRALPDRLRGRNATPPPRRPWSDPSRHNIRFVTVDENVQVEVLDWKGSGQPLVLLAGLGSSAHIFDDLAPKLSTCCRVYAITRRGHGISSHPAQGYDTRRLADDVLRVIDSLAIEKPVLVGHSIAARELKALALDHPARIAGVVFIDPPGDAVDGGDFPTPIRDAQPSYFVSFHAFRVRQMEDSKFAFPESELRSVFAARPDGSVGTFKSTDSVLDAMVQGQNKRDGSKIRIPVLTLPETPDKGTYFFLTHEADALEAIEQFVAGLPKS